ncbi:fucose isomerase [Clostridia bacterium]|nr:fucose isomerase [Clostridia bacterium]
MLQNIPKILSPELLSVLCAMGHSDVIVLADGNFPVGAYAGEPGIQIVRADGHGIPALLDAILTLIPLDSYIDKPIRLMQKMDVDKDLEIAVWKDYEKIVRKHEKRGKKAIGHYDRFEFYEQAKKAYCIVYTGEEAVYANILLQKGVVK